MPFSFVRFVLFAFVGLAVGFILVALGLAVAGQPISAPQIFPWALGIAGLAGLIAGFWRTSR